MLTYIAFYAWMILLVFLFSKNKANKNVYTCMMFLTIFLFAGLRGMVGTDTVNYLDIYNQLGYANKSSFGSVNLEPLFLAYTILHKNIIDNNFLYLLSISLIQTLLLLAVFIKTKNKSIFILTYSLVFYLEFHFNTVRVGISLLIFILALKSFGSFKRNSIALISVLVHFSSLAFAPLYIATMDKGRSFFRSLLFFLIILSVAVILNYEYIYGKFFTYLSIYSNYEDNNLIGSLKSAFISLLILLTLYLVRSPSRYFVVSSVIILVCFLLKEIFPFFYRIVFASTFIYFYFIIEEMENKPKSNSLIIFFCFFLTLNFYLSLVGIYSQRDLLEKRVLDGSYGVSRLIDSSFIPYQFYWNDSYERY